MSKVNAKALLFRQSEIEALLALVTANTQARKFTDAVNKGRRERLRERGVRIKEPGPNHDIHILERVKRKLINARNAKRDKTLKMVKDVIDVAYDRINSEEEE